MRVTIASGKGGTGKTTLSTNLSSYLASQNHSVVLADLDVEEPNVALFLKGEKKQEKVAYKNVPRWVKAECTLCGKCADVCNFNAIVALPDDIIIYPQLCHSCYACSELCPTDSLPMIPEPIGKIEEFASDGLSCIEGRLDLGQEMAVGLIAQTINYTQKHYSQSIQIFDAPPGTSCPMIEATKESDFVILVTEPTPFGLNDLTLAVETMRVLKQPFGVVINRYGIGDGGVERYCKEEGIDIIATIKNDKEVAKCYARGELLYPKIDHFKEALEDIVAYIGEIA
ncbi:MAG TPA: ATPase [Campylobacterales bacterium]|nr:ATPase [Campylobacterales bacterium]